MTTLREAAQQALEALDGVLDSYGEPLDLLSISGGAYEALQCREAITALRAALAEPENWELRRLREELERCKQTCAATSEAWREESALAKPTVPSDCTDSHQPVAWLFTNLQSGDYDFCYQEDEHDHDREMWHKQPLYTAPPQQALTIERLRDALVASRIIPPAAVEDPDEYDDGVTLFRIEALHRRIT